MQTGAGDGAVLGLLEHSLPYQPHCPHPPLILQVNLNQPLTNQPRQNYPSNLIGKQLERQNRPETQ